jgi:hypothetical protein
MPLSLAAAAVAVAAFIAAYGEPSSLSAFTYLICTERCCAAHYKCINILNLYEPRLMLMVG